MEFFKPGHGNYVFLLPIMMTKGMQTFSSKVHQPRSSLIIICVITFGYVEQHAHRIISCIYQCIKSTRNYKFHVPYHVIIVL